MPKFRYSREFEEKLLEVLGLTDRKTRIWRIEIIAQAHSPVIVNIIEYLDIPDTETLTNVLQLLKPDNEED